MRPLNELGMTDKFGDIVSTPSPTPNQFKKVEMEIGFPLPVNYKTFLEFSNGGYSTLNTFRDKTGFQWVIDRFFEITENIDNTYHVLFKYQHRWSKAPKGIVPFAQDGGGNLFCLDLRKEIPAPIVIWVHDTTGNPIREIAVSFEAFIDSLSIYDESLDQ